MRSWLGVANPSNESRDPHSLSANQVEKSSHSQPDTKGLSFIKKSIVAVLRLQEATGR